MNKKVVNVSYGQSQRRCVVIGKGPYHHRHELRVFQHPVVVRVRFLHHGAHFFFREPQLSIRKEQLELTQVKETVPVHVVPRELRGDELGELGVGHVQKTGFLFLFFHFLSHLLVIGAARPTVDRSPGATLVLLRVVKHLALEITRAEGVDVLRLRPKDLRLMKIRKKVGWGELGTAGKWDEIGVGSESFWG
jgi:hypothetical protein|tara:strand:+ start:13662 stop:14237 length:576 start_codon:yes stop_codon:yes gene_type:complete